MTYVFGPVLSRRLGRSLGVDLLPPKTCSMNCIYCECGVTTHLTAERGEWVPTQAVIAELDTVLKSHPPLDFITFSGAGEPLLHSGAGEIVQWLKRTYPQYKVCVLTNSSPLGIPGVAESLIGLDRIVPSLDGVTETSFTRITRPAPGLTVEQMIQGLIRFRHISPTTEMWMEIFIVPGVNDSDLEIAAFADAVSRIRPDRVQLNSLDRPGCVDWIRRPDAETAEKFRIALSPFCPVEMVGKIDFDAVASVPMPQVGGGTLRNRILTTCLRRPCTLQDLVALIGLPTQEIEVQLDNMTARGTLKTTCTDGKIFYTTAGDV